MPRRIVKRKLSSAASDNKGNRKNSKTVPNVKTLMPYLHHDIWFEILSWLSASVLYNIVSRVCNTWATIIRNPCFVDKHLSRSTSGLVIYDRMFPIKPPRFLQLRDGLVASYGHRDSHIFPGLMHSSYQGISLFCYSERGTGTIHVINHVTKQIAEISGPDLVKCNYSVIRDRRDRELKLVCACRQSFFQITWYVQRLGIEKSWKKISTWKSTGLMDCHGMSIGYFVVYVVAYEKSIVVLDVSDETINIIHCPVEDRVATYVQKGNELSCISHNSGRILIHVLKDFLAGTWSLYQILDYGCIHEEPPENHRFLGWIGNSDDELVVRLCKLCKFGSCSNRISTYHVGGTHEWKYFTYSLKAKSIRYINRWISKTDKVLVHTDSLLSWKTL